MLKSFAAIFRKYPAYRLLFGGALISSAGSGLTQVAVYGELAGMNAAPATFALAFAVSVIPGLFSSQLAERVLRRFTPAQTLVGSEILGALFLLFPTLGMTLHHTGLLLAAQFSASLIAGVAMPAGMAVQSTLFKEPEELAAASALGTIAFSSQVIIGYGSGSLLYGRISNPTYLILDAASFLVGAWLISKAAKADARLALLPPMDPSANDGQAMKAGSFITEFRAFNSDQKRAFLLMPILTCVGAPVVALLPSIGMKFGASTVPLFLFSKTIGQLLGPLLLATSQYESASKNSRHLIAALAGFAALYLVVASIPLHLGMALILISCAHLLSNRVYSLAVFALPRFFPVERIVRTAATQYQFQTALMALLGAAAGNAAGFFPVAGVIASFSTLAVGAAILLLGSLGRAE